MVKRKGDKIIFFPDVSKSKQKDKGFAPRNDKQEHNGCGWVALPDGTKVYRVVLDTIKDRETILKIKEIARKEGISEDQVVAEAVKYRELFRQSKTE